VRFAPSPTEATASALWVQHRKGVFLLATGQRLPIALLAHEEEASAEIFEVALQRLGPICPAYRVIWRDDLPFRQDRGYRCGNSGGRGACR